MNGRRVVVGGALLAVGMLAAIPGTWVLLSGDPAVLPVVIFGLAAVAFGAVQARGGLRAPAAGRAGPLPGQRRRHAGTYSPPTYYGTDTGGYLSDGGSSDGGGWSGGGGDSGGGGGGS
ncbi:hypothetical protein AB0B85_10915 [Micromonospora sp. NPDC049044]|uniref:hypothetical protein n=1 Tax=Micromonospora sp. NPDC049044 TaxID=3154827 RepID=UPI0033FCAD19